MRFHLTTKKQYNHPKQGKEPKHKEKTSNNLDPKLARPYSKDPSDLNKSAIMSGSLPKRNWKAKPIHKSRIWCSIKLLSFSWIKLLRKRGKIHPTTPTPMSSTQQPILVLVVQATNLPGKKDTLERLTWFPLVHPPTKLEFKEFIWYC